MGSQKSRQSPGKTGVTQGNHFADKTPLCLGSFPRTWAGWRWWVCSLKDQGAWPWFCACSQVLSLLSMQVVATLQTALQQLSVLPAQGLYLS